MIYSIAIFLFGFCLGGIIIFFGVIAVIYRFLTHFEDKTNEFMMRRRRSRDDAPANLSEQQNKEELASYLKLQTWSDSAHGPNKSIPWRFGVVRENTIFVYEDNTKEELFQMINLNGTEVTTSKKNWASPMNALEISHDDIYLYDSAKKVCLFFATGFEAEQWYWATFRGSQLYARSEEFVKEELRVKQHFSMLRSILFDADGKTKAPEAWANALLPRFWWNLFDNKSFHKFVMKRLGKRIAKITDFPKFIESMVLYNIHIGPNLPLVSNIELANFADDGSMDIDMDIEYNGGFSMTIKINTTISLPGTSVNLPATAIVYVNKLKGRVRLHVSAPPCERFWIGFHTLPDTDIRAETEIGLLDSNGLFNSKFNVLKKMRADLTKVIVNKLKSDIVGEKMVFPNMDDFPIPYFTHQENEEDENYLSQVILSREQREKKKNAGILDISPTGVTILNRRIESDQIVPLLKSYASKDGVIRLTTNGVRTLQHNRPTQKSFKENMEKGRQAIIDMDLPGVKDGVVDSLRQTYAKMGTKRDIPPDFEKQRLLPHAKETDPKALPEKRERKLSFSGGESKKAKEDKKQSASEKKPPATPDKKSFGRKLLLSPDRTEFEKRLAISTGQIERSRHQLAPPSPHSERLERKKY